MKRNWKSAVVCFLITALVATSCFAFGCGKGGEGATTITIGMLTDVTGPAGSIFYGITSVTKDMARYVSEQNPIPGVKIRVVVYDTQYNASRFIPGFDWLLDQGSKVIVTPIPDAAETLKPFAETAKVPIFTWGASDAMIEPPGWVFCANPATFGMAKTLANWLSEQWANYPAKPKIACFGTNTAGDMNSIEGIKAYCQEHPDKFEWVEAYQVPIGTMSFYGGIHALKDCDYIDLTSAGLECANFIKEFRAEGYTATFVGAQIVFGGMGWYVKVAGWDALDGIIPFEPNRWWTEQYPLPLLANELLQTYRPDEATAIIDMGSSYCTCLPGAYMLLDILRNGVEQVGAQKFDGQAFYNVAIKFDKTYDGLYEVGFNETVRVAANYAAPYRVSAAAKDMVRLSDWMPLLE